MKAADINRLLSYLGDRAADSNLWAAAIAAVFTLALCGIVYLAVLALEWMFS